jgi:hypothetical protein
LPQLRPVVNVFPFCLMSHQPPEVIHIVDFPELGQFEMRRIKWALLSRDGIGSEQMRQKCAPK